MLGAYESCVGLPNKKQVQAKLSKELGTESLLFLPVLNVATTNCRKAAKKEVYRPPESSGTSEECSVLSSLSPPLNQPILHFSISSRPSQCTWYLSKGLLYSMQNKAPWSILWQCLAEDPLKDNPTSRYKVLIGELFTLSCLMEE